LRVLRDLGAGADIVSGGEMLRALAAGFEPARVVFSGVGKTRVELAAALDAQVGHIHLESSDELRVLSGLAGERRQQVTVGIRVNPDVTADTHPYISTGQGGIKFGVPFDQVLELASAVHRTQWLRLDSIAMHIGSQILDPKPYQQGIERLLDLIARLRSAGVDTLQNLDIGGGLGIRYKDEVPLTPERFAAAILPLAQRTGLTIVMEPGRYLVGSAGVMLTTVLSHKHSGGKELVLVDAASRRRQTELSGRTSGNVVVNVPGPASWIGRTLRVAVERAGPGMRSAKFHSGCPCQNDINLNITA